MTWFKVDDGFHDHPKVQDAGAAVALWVLAGSWAARHLTDGWIGTHNVKRLLPDDWEAMAECLVQVGLWREEARDGRPGYVFHDWADMQPSRAQVLDERAKQAERVRNWRERRRATRNAASGTVTPGATERATEAATEPARTGVRTGAPSRPDPTTTPNGVVRVGGRRSNEWKPEEDPDFENRVKEQVAERMGNREPAITPTRQAAVQEMRSRLSGKASSGRSE